MITRKTIKRLLGQRVLGRYVRRLRQENDFLVIAVVGSVGKTSAKAAIATVLSQSKRVRWQEGNYNDLLSVPLVFFGLEMPRLTSVADWLRTIRAMRSMTRQQYPYDVVVLELGTDGPGQLSEFASYGVIDIAVLSAIAPEHMEYFVTMDAVATEELSIATFSKLLIYNADECAKEFMSLLPEGVSTKTYGVKAKDAVIVRTAAVDPVTLRRLVTMRLDGADFEFETNMPGAHSVKALAAAAAVAQELGVPRQQLLASLEKVAPFSGRMQILPGIRKTVLIDDTYNASPTSVIAALDTLYEIKQRPLVAVLGTMNELGLMSEEAHTLVGRHCKASRLDFLITVGREAKMWLAATAQAQGVKTYSFDSPYAAAEWLRKEVPENAVILFKGSQNGVFLEEAVERLLRHPADASKLVRQSAYWSREKQKQFKDFV